MAETDDSSARKSEELTAIIHEIQGRVRGRVSTGNGDDYKVSVPDLMPLFHARDSAEVKVAAIGSVNPRPPGLINNIIQSVKRLVARAMDWHVRDQVEFNRAVTESITAIIEDFNEINRALTQLAATQAEFKQQFETTLNNEVRELKDISSHWIEWRREWERKLSTNEIQFLRSAADLQTAFQQRVTEMESNFQQRVIQLESSYRDLANAQHTEFTASLKTSSINLQERLRQDLDNIRGEYERVIHNELRTIRQRAPLIEREQLPIPAAAPPEIPAPEKLSIDNLRFTDRFRGTEDHVQQNQKFYLDKFSKCKQVLDLGCGRGEFLGLLKQAGIPARGIDIDAELVTICRRKDLDVEQADLLKHLDSLESESLDGIFCAHVVEHLPPRQIPELIKLAAEKLCRHGLLAIETPNPECLAIYSSHFYADPTHQRPVPSSLMAFYLEEAGFGQIDIKRLSPATDSMSSLKELPENFRNAFFGGLDYAILAHRL